MTLFGGNRTVAVGLDLDPRSYLAKLKAAEKATADFAKSGIEAAGKHRRAFDEIGSGAVKAGVAIGAVSAVAVVSFARFDKAMSRAAAGTNATASQLTQLRKAAIDAGRDTQFSATEAADAITALGKAGVSVRDILAGGLTGSLSLAAAGELEVKDAAEIAATAMTQFALQGKDLPHVADLLAAGAGKAQGDVTDLANALKYVGPVAHGMGVSIEETVGTLAEFASQGILSEQAGTSLRGLLTSLTSPSQAAAREMKGLGINLYDAEGRFIGVAGVANELHQTMQDLTEAERNEALGRIFGNEQITAARVLYEGGAEAVQEWTAKVNDSRFAAVQAGRLMDNLAGDVEQLKGSLETAFIAGGSGANDGLRTLTQGATGAVNAFTALPESVQKSTVVAAGLTAGVAILGGGMLILAGKVATAKTQLAELGISGRKAALGIKVAGGAIAGLTVATALPDIAAAFDRKVGAVDDSTAALQVSMLDLAKTGHLTGEAAKVWGRDFDGSAKSIWRVDRSIKEVVKNSDKPWWNWNTTQGSTMAKNLDELGKALAGLVQSGHGKEAADAFNQIAKAAGLQGNETGKLLKLMPEYADALNAVKAESGDTTTSVEDLARGVQTEAQQAADAAKATADFAASVEDAGNQFLQTRGDLRGLESAIAEASDAVKENGRTLDIHTEKGRANQEALDAVGAAALALADDVLTSGGSQQQFQASLESSRRRLIQVGIRFGLTKKEAQEYADKVLGIPATANTKAVFDDEEAIRRLRSFIALAEQHGQFVFSPGVSAVPGSLQKRSDGHAGGGLIPGPPSRRDTVPAMLATGEFVVNAAATTRHRGILEAINTGAIKQYADGGLATPYGLSDVQSRYEASKLQPITVKEYLAAVRAALVAQNATKNANLAVSKAERDLAHVRRNSPRDARAIHDAEDRLDKARRSYALARSNEAIKEKAAASATARRNAPKGFDLGLYEASLGRTVHQQEAYRRDLAKVGRRGGTQLAALLEGMGADGADLIHALAGASTKQFAEILALLKRLNPDAFAAAPTATYKTFGRGGIEDHVAQYSGGSLRIWGEPETGGEAYIPLAAAKRGRSRLLASDVVARMGGAVAWSRAQVPATSAATAPAGSGGGMSVGSLLHADRIEVLRGTPDQVADDVMFRLRARGGI